MIGGFYHEDDSKSSVPNEKVPQFFLINKIGLNSVGLDNENRKVQPQTLETDVLILAHFCEIVGPIPLIVYPEKVISKYNLDIIVLKAMSADYQSCEHGDYVFNSSTQTLNIGNQMCLFVHYFTLWDIQARGYVRPCCIITCCKDKVRARDLFYRKLDLFKQMLEPFISKNVVNFYREVKDNLLSIQESINEFNVEDHSEESDINMKQLDNLKTEYTLIIQRLEEQMYLDGSHISDTNENVFVPVNNSFSSFRRLRPIFELMDTSESTILEKLIFISKDFQSTETAELFTLTEGLSKDNIENSMSLSFKCDEKLVKFNVNYFHTAASSDKGNLFTGRGSCNCRGSASVCDTTEIFKNFKSNCIFPNLIDIQGYLCSYVSNICKNIGTQNTAKLLATLFSQCHLVVLTDNSQSYYHLMRFLILFLPKPYNQNFIPTRTDWPTLDQMNHSPATFLKKDSLKTIFPQKLEKFMITYDATKNEFTNGYKYNKGYITNFLDSFKALGYNHNQLSILVNIMLLSYVDIVYQWISLIMKRDRKWIIEHLTSLGITLEDVTIGENLALYVLQKLHSNKLESCLNNLFISSPTLFTLPPSCYREMK